jgi:hypothetical protein
MSAMPALVNTDPLNPNDGMPEPYELLRFGIRGVRMVPRCWTDDHGDDPNPVHYPNPKQLLYMQQLHEAGLAAFGVVTEQSHGVMFTEEPFDLYQLGNEPDVAGTGDSKTADEYSAWYKLYYDTWFVAGRALAGVPVITAGLASGNTAYWRALRGRVPWASGMAVHPYGKTPAQAADLIRSYQAITPGLPVFVTEWHQPTDVIPAYVMMLNQLAGVAGHAFFCWHNYAGFQLGERGARLLGLLA